MGQLITSKYGCSNIKILQYDNNSVWRSQYCDLTKKEQQHKSLKKNAVIVYGTMIELNLFAIVTLPNPGL